MCASRWRSKRTIPPRAAPLRDCWKRFWAILRRKSERALVGFDFPLGFPRGTAAALKLSGAAPWRQMLDFVTKEVKDKADQREQPLSSRRQDESADDRRGLPVLGRACARCADHALGQARARTWAKRFAGVPPGRGCDQGPVLDLEALLSGLRRRSGAHRHAGGFAPARGARGESADLAVRNRLEAARGRRS